MNLVSRLQERIAELSQKENEALIQLGMATGAKQEAQYWLDLLQGQNTGEGVSPSPEGYTLEEITEGIARAAESEQQEP